MSTQETRTRPRWRRVLRVLVVTVVVVFLVDLTARSIWEYVEAKRLNEEIARISAAGEPVTFKDLDTGRPKLSEPDDGGPYYEAALVLLRDKDAQSLWDAWSTHRDSLRGSSTSQPSRDVTDKVDKLLADNALTLSMLDRGADCPGCNFDVGVKRGMDLCLKRLRRARVAAKLLSGRTLVRASQGKGDEAADSLICLLQFRRVFDRRPVAIASLVEIACVALACEDTGIVLQIGQPSEPALARLRDALLAADEPGLVKRTVLAERVYCLQWMRYLIAGHMVPGVPGDATADIPDAWPKWGSWGRPVMQHLTVNSLRDYAGLVTIADKPLPDALDAMRGTGPMRSTFGQLFALPIERVFVHAAGVSAEVRCAALAVSVELYRRAHHRLPEALGELAPEQAKPSLTDPFTGNDLLYRHDERSYAVYSVGEDGTDDNGDVDAREQGERPRDMGIRIRLLPARAISRTGS